MNGEHPQGPAGPPKSGEVAAATPDEPAKGMGSAYKRAFVSGLGTILPTIVTLWVLSAAYNFVSNSIASPLSATIKEGFLVQTSFGNEVAVAVFDVEESVITPTKMSNPPTVAEKKEEAARIVALRAAIDEHYPEWFGLLAAVVVVFAIGFLVASLIGQRLVGILEGALARLPLIRSIYPSAKQVVEFFLAAEESRKSFQTVVACQWPRAGYWSVGFVTSGGLKNVSDANDGKRFVHVFLPNSPTPMTGYVVLAPIDELVVLDMTVEQGFRYLLSAGVIIPPGQELPGMTAAEATRPSGRMVASSSRLPEKAGEAGDAAS